MQFAPNGISTRKTTEYRRIQVLLHVVIVDCDIVDRERESHGQVHNILRVVATPATTESNGIRTEFRKIFFHVDFVFGLNRARRSKSGYDHSPIIKRRAVMYRIWWHERICIQQALCVGKGRGKCFPWAIDQNSRWFAVNEGIRKSLCRRSSSIGAARGVISSVILESCGGPKQGSYLHPVVIPWPSKVQPNIT